MTTKRSLVTTLISCLLLWIAAPAPSAPARTGPVVAAAGSGNGQSAGKKEKGKKKKKKKKKGPKAKAKVALKKGKKLYGKGDYEAALDAFRTSYDLVSAPMLRWHIGMCLLALGRWLEAEEELTAYLDDPGESSDQEMLDDAQDALGEIDDHVGTIVIETDEDGVEILVDGQPADGWEIRLEEGAYEIVATAEGYDSITRTVDVTGGREEEVEFTFRDEEEDEQEAATGKDREKLPIVWFASTAGLTGALAVTAIIMGSVALSRQNTYESMDADDGWRSYRDSTLKLGVATDVLWGIAGAAAVAAIVLAIFTDFEKHEEKQALSVVPVAGIGWLGLEGEF